MNSFNLDDYSLKIHKPLLVPARFYDRISNDDLKIDEYISQENSLNKLFSDKKSENKIKEISHENTDSKEPKIK